MNILNTLIIFIDNLPTKQWLFGLDIEKMEKGNKTFQSRSYQIFTAIKNIHLTLLYEMSA
jgi:hypothetical protein